MLHQVARISRLSTVNRLSGRLTALSSSSKLPPLPSPPSSSNHSDSDGYSDDDTSSSAFMQLPSYHLTQGISMETNSTDSENPLPSLSPKEIVHALDQHIIGQHESKKAVAVALRERWRRNQLEDEELKSEVMPSHILMSGPTGSGKTETARRLAKIADAPFVKVDATSFTEVGIVGPNVKSMVEDLVEAALKLLKDKMQKEIEEESRARALRFIAHLIDKKPRKDLITAIENGEYDHIKVSIPVHEPVEFPLNPNLKFAFSIKPRSEEMPVKDALHIIQQKQSKKLTDEMNLKEKAIKFAENNGIIFIDEIDKIASKHSSASVIDKKNEGVQKELLGLFEGASVETKHGLVNTKHVLFIASGAFHISKASDLLPELLGRLPIRVDFKPLKEMEFRRILTEPKYNLIHQHTKLMETEGVKLNFTKEGIEKIASICWKLNEQHENIGARRIRTVVSKTIEEVSFGANEYEGKEVTIDDKYVAERVQPLLKKIDLNKYII